MSSQAFIQNLGPIDHASAQGAQREILDLAQKQVGFIPNMYAMMANAPAVLSTYLHGYSLFRSESGLTPPEQEVVLLAVSQVNGCNYCTAAHSMIADKVSKVPADVLASIRHGKPIADPRLAALYDMSVEMVKTHGKPDAKVVKAFLDAGFEERALLYLVLAIAVKTLSNFTNHAFATPVDDRFAAYKV